jgi:hypothetical protein
MTSTTRWLTRTFGITAVIAFVATMASAQQGNQSKTGGTPPAGTTGSPKTNHPTTTEPNKMRPVLPAYHPPTATNTAPVIPHPATSTIAPNSSTATIITPNGTTTISSGNTHTNSVAVQPSINTSPYYQAMLQNELLQRAMLSPFYNPYAMNPYYSLLNPLSNPLAGYNNPFVGFNNPFVGFNNPFMYRYGMYPYVNPVTARILQADAFAFPFQTPAIFAINPYTTPLMAKVLLADAYAFPFQMPALYTNPAGLLGTGLVITPPVAYQQPGALIPQGPNLAFNPLTGTVVHPVSGFATMLDGSTFYRLPGSTTGSNVYFNPVAGSFFNPLTGVVGKPAMINGLVP